MTRREDDLAELAHREFVIEVIAELDQNEGWERTQQEILGWFEAWKRGHAQDRDRVLRC